MLVLCQPTGLQVLQEQQALLFIAEKFNVHVIALRSTHATHKSEAEI